MGQSNHIWGFINVANKSKKSCNKYLRSYRCHFNYSDCLHLQHRGRQNFPILLFTIFILYRKGKIMTHGKTVVLGYRTKSGNQWEILWKLYDIQYNRDLQTLVAIVGCYNHTHIGIRIFWLNVKILLLQKIVTPVWHICQLLLSLTHSVNNTLKNT